MKIAFRRFICHHSLFMVICFIVVLFELLEATFHQVPTIEIENPQTVKKERPIMYTFHAKVPVQENGRKGTGMTDETDAAMLRLWREKWYQAGWEPRVLSLAHAMMHEDFDEFNKQLQQIPLGVKNRIYDQYCYLRWLAMAAVGGGWMSDYDTLPIRPFDSTFGPFTVFSAARQGRGIPCLMSGSASEWNEMAHAILQNGINHSANATITLWSDMFALMDLQTTASRPYLVNNTVTSGAVFLTGQPFGDRECQLASHSNAIHFSHSMIGRGVLREGESIRDRPKIARNIMSLLEQKCK